jgi:hypothetical protein
MQRVLCNMFKHYEIKNRLCVYEDQQSVHIDNKPLNGLGAGFIDGIRGSKPCVIGAWNK